MFATQKPPPTFSGGKLADARSRRKLTQVALCALVRPDLSVATLRRWETDKTVPGGDDLLKLAHALGVEVRELVA